MAAPTTLPETCARRRLTAMLGAAAAILCLAATGPARAALIQNGDFSSSTATTTYNGATVGTETTNSNLAGWQFTGCTASNCGFSFLATGNFATNGWYDAQDGHESFAGTQPGAIPGSGNAFLSDGNYGTQAIYQAVSGLKIGDTYTLAFTQASFEQSGYTGGFTSNWAVGLGNGTFNTTNYAGAAIRHHGGLVRRGFQLGATDDDVRCQRHHRDAVLLRHRERWRQPAFPCCWTASR